MRTYGKNFKDDVALNQYKLNEEAEINPSLMQYYSDLLAEAKAAKDATENKLKMTMAEVELEVRRSDPKTYKLEKFTEAVITSLVETDDRVKSLKSEVLDAKEDVYTYEGAVDALRDRSSMIKVLQALWCGGYYAANGSSDN